MKLAPLCLSVKSLYADCRSVQRVCSAHPCGNTATCVDVEAVANRLQLYVRFG